MTKGLGRSIKLMQCNHELQGLLINTRVDIKKHQQFVDDTMLMGHPSVQEGRNFKICLENFPKASGVEVNEKKS